MAPGERSKFSAPMLETEVYRKQMYCIEESICDIVGTFRHPPQPFGAPIFTRRPENCDPLTPLVTLLVPSGSSFVHLLNLAGVHAVGSSELSDRFFAVVEIIYSFFSASTHMWAVLVKHVPLCSETSD